MSRSGLPLRVLLGGAGWLGAFTVLFPSPLHVVWAWLLLLLGALVIVPLGLHLVAPPGEGGALGRLVNLSQLPAALLLGGAYLLPQGLPAAALALSWLAVTGLIALLGLARLRRHGPRSMGESCIAFGMIYLVVGGAWAVSDRLGFRPLGFDPVIVLLTAIHFHYAGFALPLLAGLAIREVKSPLAAPAGLGVIAGVPLVALGITASRLGLPTVVELLAAWVMSAAGFLVAGLHARLILDPARPGVARLLWAVSALSLTGGMVLAALYGSRFYAYVPWLDISWMRALHGTANALGFALPGLLAWTLAAACRSAQGQVASAPVS